MPVSSMEMCSKTLAPKYIKNIECPQLAEDRHKATKGLCDRFVMFGVCLLVPC